MPQSFDVLSNENVIVLVGIADAENGWIGCFNSSCPRGILNEITGYHN